MELRVDSEGYPMSPDEATIEDLNQEIAWLKHRLALWKRAAEKQRNIAQFEREERNVLAQELDVSESHVAVLQDIRDNDPWKQAIDKELVLSLQTTADSYDNPHKALHDIICWNIDVATDPRCNGGYELTKTDIGGIQDDPIE